AHVELESFHVSMTNGIWAEGKGLRIWPPATVAGVFLGTHDAGDAKPIIRLDDFRFHAPLHYKPGEPIRIAVVQLTGLDVDVPSKPHLHREETEPSGTAPNESHSSMLSFVVDSIDCKNAHLTIETSKPGKLPL